MNNKNDFTVLVDGEVFFVGSIRTAEKVFDCLVEFKNLLESKGLLSGSVPVMMLTACKYIV